LNNYLSKVVWMTRPREESNIADRTIVAMSGAEPVLLDVGYAFHDETNRPKDNASNVAASAKARLRKARHIWRVEDSYWQ